MLSLMAENPQISISALANAMRSLGESNEDNTGTHEKALTENDKFRVIVKIVNSCLILIRKLNGC
jgi:hypothetical protein